MTSIRALQRRVAKLEQARKPRPSPFTIWFGSFDAWVKRQILPGIESGAHDSADIVVVVATLRRWETDGTWDNEHASAFRSEGGELSARLP